MGRVCAALGTWQIIILVSALRMADELQDATSAEEDILVLYGNELSQEMKLAMEELAHELRRWNSILWADDLMTPDGLDSRESLRERLARLRTRILANNPSELWLGKLAETPEKLLLEAYPRACIVHYEDGMHSYVSPRPYNRSGRELLIHPLVAIDTLRLRIIDEYLPLMRVRETWITRAHLKRIKCSYLYLAGWIRVPAIYKRFGKLIRLDPRFLLSTIDQVSERMSGFVPNIPKEYKEKSVLVIGQCFARWNIMNRQEEQQVYQRVVRGLLDEGYHVFWKEHPRVDRGFFPSLDLMFHGSNFTNLNLPDELPIEIVAKQIAGWICVSASSSALLYLNRLYGISTYTFTHWLDSLYWDDFKAISSMIQELVPQIELLDGLHGS